jgi:hypothetical protein
MYCQQARAGFGNGVYNPSCGVNTDQVEFIFEQDCLDDINLSPTKAYDNWFIFRIPTDKLDHTKTADMKFVPE